MTAAQTTSSSETTLAILRENSNRLAVRLAIARCALTCALSRAAKVAGHDGDRKEEQQGKEVVRVCRCGA